jgi:hypothetical protein
MTTIADVSLARLLDDARSLIVERQAVGAGAPDPPGRHSGRLRPGADRISPEPTWDIVANVELAATAPIAGTGPGGYPARRVS